MGPTHGPPLFMGPSDPDLSVLHAGIFSLWDHVSQSISLLPTSGIFILSRPCASFISWPCALFISWPRAFSLPRPSAIFIYILHVMPQSFHLASYAGGGHGGHYPANTTCCGIYYPANTTCCGLSCDHHYHHHHVTSSSCEP